MSLLPDTDRILLGPGPTLTAPRVMRAMASPTLSHLDPLLFRREASIDGHLTLAEIDQEFVAAHEMLQPFGAGNPHPLFAVHDVEVTGTRTFAEDCCELALHDPTGRATGVLWPGVKQLGTQLAGKVDLLVRVEPDRYSGARLEIVDSRSA